MLTQYKPGKHEHCMLLVLGLYLLSDVTVPATGKKEEGWER